GTRARIAASTTRKRRRGGSTQPVSNRDPRNPAGPGIRPHVWEVSLRSGPTRPAAGAGDEHRPEKRDVQPLEQFGAPDGGPDRGPSGPDDEQHGVGVVGYVGGLAGGEQRRGVDEHEVAQLPGLLEVIAELVDQRRGVANG